MRWFGMASIKVLSTIIILICLLSAYIVTYYIPTISFHEASSLTHKFLEQDNAVRILENLSDAHMILYGTLLSIAIFSIISLISMQRYIKKSLHKAYQEKLTILEEEIRNEIVNSEKYNFLNNISHELRTPLNSILGFSAMIKDEVMGPVEPKVYKEYIHDIHSSGHHLLELINDLLDLTKAEANQLQLKSIPVDIDKIIKGSIHFLQPLIETSNIRIARVQKSKRTLIIRGDPKRFKQVIHNLLSNALKFTPSGGTISIIISELDEYTLRILISDTGIGIADESLELAMSAFGQIDNRLSRHYDGVGLGLPLTKKLVELMQGNMTIRSGINTGTIVELLFPLIPEEAYQEI